MRILRIGSGPTSGLRRQANFSTADDHGYMFRPFECHRAAERGDEKALGLVHVTHRQGHVVVSSRTYGREIGSWRGLLEFAVTQRGEVNHIVSAGTTPEPERHSVKTARTKQFELIPRRIAEIHQRMRAVHSAPGIMRRNAEGFQTPLDAHKIF